MKKFVLLASLATLTLTAVSAEARERWRNRQYDAWQDRPVYIYEEEDDDVASYDDSFEDEVIIIPKRRFNRRQQIEEQVERELWWLENGARDKLEQRARTAKPAKKPVVKKAVAKPLPAKAKVAATAKLVPAKPKSVVATKTDKQPVDDVQTASLSKPEVVARPKAVTGKAVSGKTIGCTAGAAVVTGYGFGGVKPKACSGSTYAYTATRAGKNYEIQLTAASGEITDVKKLN